MGSYEFPKNLMLHPIIYRDLLLFPMKYVHPPNRFMFTDLTVVDLGCYKALMSQD
jgi:hypothetical protein